MNFGMKMKCENCEYGYVKEKNRKIKEVFCGKLRNNMSVAYYKKMRICNLFEPRKGVFNKGN